MKTHLIKQTPILTVIIIVVLSLVIPLAAKAAHNDNCDLNTAIAVNPNPVKAWSDQITMTVTVTRQAGTGDFCSSQDYFNVAFKISGVSSNIATRTGTMTPDPTPGNNFPGQTITPAKSISFTTAVSLAGVSGFDSSKTATGVYAVVTGQRGVAPDSSGCGECGVPRRPMPTMTTNTLTLNQDPNAGGPPTPNETPRITLTGSAIVPVADPGYIGKDFQFKFTAQPNDPEVSSFKVLCGTDNETEPKLYAKTATTFRCEYPENDTRAHTVKIWAVDSLGKMIGPVVDTLVSVAGSDNGNGPPSPTFDNPIDVHKPLLDAKDLSQPVKGSLGSLLDRTVAFLLSFVAVLAIIFIIIGGFRLAFSQGNTEAVTAGRKTITWAIIGLIIALLAFAMIRILESLLY